MQIAGKEMVFIVGASRSGTTMMSRILNQHPNIGIAKRETHYFDDLRLKLSSKPPATLTTKERHRCEDYFLRLGHWRYDLQGDPEKSQFSRDELRASAAKIGTDADAYFEAFCRLNARHTSKQWGDKQIWGEKTPRHIFRVPEILERFPNARVICMVRDPRAVVTSYRDWKKQNKKLDSEHDPESKLKRERSERSNDRARKSYNILLLSMLWCSAINAALAAQKQFGAQRVRILRYEDLVSDPETQLRNITAWLGLDYDPGMLEIPLHNSSFSDGKRSRGLSTEPVNRWRQKLSNTEIGIVQTCCGRMLTDTGYKREPVHTPYVLLAWKWITLPIAVVRATTVNNRRIGNLPAFIWRRLQSLAILKNYRKILPKNLAKQ